MNNDNSYKALNIFDYFEILVNNFKIIIYIPAITTVIAIFYALFFTTPIYDSTAKIMSSSSSSSNSLSQGVGFAAQLGFSLPSGNKPDQWLYKEIIGSRTLGKRLLKLKFDTKKYGKDMTLLHIFSDGEKVDFNNVSVSNGIVELNNLIYFKKDVSGLFYLLKVSAFEPGFAADLAKAIIKELDSYQRDYNISKVRETRLFIEGRIDEVGKELTRSEEALKNFRDRNRRITNSPSLQLEEERLSREVTVQIGVYTTLKQQLETTKIDEVKESDYVIVLDPPEPPIERSYPNKTNIVYLGGVFGISLSFFIIFIMEFFRRRTKIEKTRLKSIISLFKKNFFDWNNKLKK